MRANGTQTTWKKSQPKHHHKLKSHTLIDMTSNYSNDYTWWHDYDTIACDFSSYLAFYAEGTLTFSFHARPRRHVYVMVANCCSQALSILNLWFKIHETFVLLCKGPTATGNDELDVEESIVVRCEQGGSITVETCNVCTLCEIVVSNQARFVVIMLQPTSWESAPVMRHQRKQRTITGNTDILSNTIYM